MPNHKNRIKWDVKIRQSLIRVIADYVRTESLYSRKRLQRNRHLRKMTRSFLDTAKYYHRSYCDCWDEKEKAIQNQIAFAVTSQSYEKLFKCHRHGALNKKSYETLLELEGIKLTA